MIVESNYTMAIATLGDWLKTRSSGMPDALQKSVPLPSSLTLCPGIVWIDKDAVNET